MITIALSVREVSNPDFLWQIVPVNHSLSASEVLRRKLFLVLAGCGFAAVSIFELDMMIASFFATPGMLGFRKFCRELTDLGEGAPYFALSLALIVFGYGARSRYSEWSKHWGLTSLRALLLVGLSLHLLKFLVGRQRPHLSEEFDSQVFSPLNIHWHWQSFPSGHAQVSFLVATFAATLFPKFKYMFLFFGSAIALTRVPIAQHFLSDVIVGGLVGHIGALLVLSKASNRRAAG